MSDLSYNIGLIPMPDTKWATGTGYVFLPSDIPREEFITNCYIQGTISIRTEDGGVYHNCPCSQEVFNKIYWPDLEGHFGSIITYMTEPRHQQPIAIAVLNPNDEVVDLKEGQYKLGRRAGPNVSEIAGENTSTANLLLHVEGQNSSNISLLASNDNGKADITIDSAGTLNLVSVGDTEVRSQSQIQTRVGETPESSSSIVQTSSLVNINASKFQINEGDQAIVLGNKLKTFLDDFIDELAKSTTTTALGQMPLLNSAQITLFKNRTQELLSEISFTD